MISTPTRETDQDDVGVLFHSILRYAEANAERLDKSIMSIGYGNLLEMATTAAETIAEHHVDTGPDWDGCVWLERLEDISEGSLAQMLYSQQWHVEHTTHRWLHSLF